MDGTMLKITGLCKNFGALQALNKVDVEVKEGEIHGIIGPNGSGKTTLFNCITGVLTPDGGSISFKGENITGMRADLVANRGIHRTFQAGKLVPNFTVLENVMSGVQDPMGRAVAETMRRLSKTKLSCAVYGVTSVQEELGLRGAQTSSFGIDPHVGIAVDVGFSSDCPDTDKKLVGDISVNKGPILFLGAYFAPNPVLAKLIRSVAKDKRIPLQLQAEAPFGRTDANVLQVNRAGVAAALLSIPNRYMHTPSEVSSLKDLELTVDLMTAVVSAIKPNMDFTPRH